ncbi:MAG: thiamine pyrophosphate-dependent enzyme [Methanolinea sp.]|nr:thiamine pyrophosphate-dependent enzyme [Methanolinea sp.]
MTKGIDALTDALLKYSDTRYTVPGYPITELGAWTGAEMVINEKTGLEYALGDSLSGRRAALIVKNVGVNACVDPLVQATAQGLNAGVVLVTGDDPTAIGSQTSQDTRILGEFAEIPVLEPGRDSCYSSVEAAFEASEVFSRVAMIRLTPDLIFGAAEEDPVSRRDRKGRLSDRSWTMFGRVTASRALFRDLQAWSEASPLNRWEGEPAAIGPEPGETRVVTVWPPPSRLQQYREIREQGLPFAWDHRGHIILPEQQMGEPPQTMEDRGFYRTFCRDCPFKSVVSLMKEAGMHPVCDAGCVVLAMNPPYGIGVASYGMGASIAVAARSTGVALTGDYALMHSGLNALVDVFEKRLPLFCVVMDNRCAAMTGKQPAHPIERYLSWADPSVMNADETDEIRKHLKRRKKPGILIVRGECPEGQEHETVEYRDL